MRSLSPPPALREPQLAVQESPRRGGGGEESATVSLSFDFALLGRLDLRIDLARDTVIAGIAAPPGAALELAEAAAGQLKDALADKTRRPRSGARHGPTRPVRRLCLSAAV
jgi:hypothetical protein